MNFIWKQIIQALLFGAAVPCLMFSTSLHFTVSGTAYEQPPAANVQQEQKPEPEVQPTEPGSAESEPTMIPVLQQSGEVEQMELEEYICRVVLGEVPASFETEALKAQAVAARTYTLRCVEAGKKHPQGAVCTDYRCCQAYKEPEMYLEVGGTEKSVEKIRDAVMDTAGQVLYFNGNLINATYFASSGGMTEDAQEVWGQAYPYLQPVVSPGEEGCGYFDNEVICTAEEFQDKLGVTLSGSPKNWFGMVTYTAGNGIDLMRIGGRLYTGVELRRIFSLRSTIFTVSTTEDSVTFRTDGFGHRVGMSQHGADAMAVTGSTYDEILAHYYQGTTLTVYSD